MPGRQGRTFSRAFFDEAITVAAKLDEKEKPLMELRIGTIILEGDIKAKVISWDSTWCAIRYGKGHLREATLRRGLMNFRYAKKKAVATEVSNARV